MAIYAVSCFVFLFSFFCDFARAMKLISEFPFFYHFIILFHPSLPSLSLHPSLSDDGLVAAWR